MRRNGSRPESGSAAGTADPPAKGSPPVVDAAAPVGEPLRERDETIVWNPGARTDAVEPPAPAAAVPDEPAPMPNARPEPSSEVLVTAQPEAQPETEAEAWPEIAAEIRPEPESEPPTLVTPVWVPSVFSGPPEPQPQPEAVSEPEHNYVPLHQVEAWNDEPAPLARQEEPEPDRDSAWTPFPVPNEPEERRRRPRWPRTFRARPADPTAAAPDWVAGPDSRSEVEDQPAQAPAPHSAVLQPSLPTLSPPAPVPEIARQLIEQATARSIEETAAQAIQEAAARAIEETATAASEPSVLAAQTGIDVPPSPAAESVAPPVPAAETAETETETETAETETAETETAETAETETAETAETETGTETETETTPGPGFVERGRIRRRARYLRRLREVQLRDIGGFVVELQRFGRERPDLVRLKIEGARRTHEELQALEHALGDGSSIRELREAGIGGACEACGAVHGSEDRYCAACGEPLRPEPYAPDEAAEPGLDGRP